MKKIKKLISKVIANTQLFKGINAIDRDGFWKRRYNPQTSLKKTAEIFNQMDGKTIVEIGTGLHGEDSGNSILVWAKKTKAKSIIAVDIDEKRLGEVKKATSQYNNIETVLNDGIEFLEKFFNKIDLLYLDLSKPDPKYTSYEDGIANVYLKAYLNARNKMSAKSLILIDDTDHINPWKQTLIIPQARIDGYEVIWTGRQTLLRRN